MDRLGSCTPAQERYCTGIRELAFLSDCRRADELAPDNWVSPDGAFLYQIYGNAAKLIGYATQPDGSLTEVTRVEIPYNSPEGLAGF